MLVARARRPGGGQLELTAVDEDSVREHAQRNQVVSPEQTWAGEIGAAGIRSRADTVVEEAAEVIAGTSPGRLDVDTRQHRPAPLVVRSVTSRGAGRSTRAGAGVQRCSGVVGGVDLV